MNRDLLERKLSEIRSYLKELAPILGEDVSTIIRDTYKLRSLERLFQLVVDTALDVNSHIIAQLNIESPDDFQSTFLILGENNIIPHDFALKIAPSVGLRNKIVHKYGRVDIKQMISAVKEEINQYEEYIRHVENFLNR